MTVSAKFLFIFFMLQLYATLPYAQSMLWQYKLVVDEGNLPSLFWLDEAGTGYFNIKKENPNIRGQYDQNLCLLMLDKDGQFKGSTYIKNCKQNALMSPFGDNRLLSSGYNCDPDSGGVSLDSWVFDYAGNLILKGKGFNENYISQVKTNNGYTFFTPESDGFKFSQLNISTIDTLFNITHTAVSLEAISRPDLGIVNNYKDPFLMSDGIWAVPLNYGKVGGGGISIDHGTVIGIKDDQILWQYPDTLSRYSLEQFAATADRMCIYMRKSENYAKKLFVFLDQNGQEIKHFFTDQNFDAIDMLLTEKHIILINRFSMVWVDFDGKMVSKIDFPNLNLGHPSTIQLDKQGNVYLAALDGTTVITKIGFEAAEEVKIDSGTKSKQEPLAISYARFDSISEQTLSVSVFPNPASIYINFVLQEDFQPKADFLIQIFSSAGNLVEEKSISENRYELDLSSYISGIYFYKIILQNESKQEFISGQFVKIGN
jgi:hypothetical protein